MTGLAGGAHPGEGEVALSLERMVGIEEVDTASNTLTALVGNAALPDPAGGRGGRPDVRHRPGRARLLLHRRQCRDQCRRQPGAALRHGAQERARARSGAGRRARHPLAEQDDEEQCGLRLDADVHRLGGDAGRDHPRRARPACPPAEHPDRRAGRRGRRGRHRRAARRREGVARRAARLRGDVERVLRHRHDHDRRAGPHRART